jgi:hypothetical protein
MRDGLLIKGTFMSRSETLIWMAAISLITFVSTIFLAGIIIDDLATPTTTLGYIKEITSIFTSILSIPFTMYGLHLAAKGLKSWQNEKEAEWNKEAIKELRPEIREAANKFLDLLFTHGYKIESAYDTLKNTVVPIVPRPAKMPTNDLDFLRNLNFKQKFTEYGASTKYVDLANEFESDIRKQLTDLNRMENSVNHYLDQYHLDMYQNETDQKEYFSNFNYKSSSPGTIIETINKLKINLHQL